ncbi:uncharacterized protein ColSpa_11235 [Colletotrichum spaethianum]|uniref:Uncharacterized protein n=1 Tax=Colletotrichum spaethianum TaxID=700344 RepID=A0AA37PF54_9PEZI|nr:uncharacterized protein ColSpa_11235 [Colletotrichum spaethianum]GKT51054.1 hypothetical protein ColSpa_11235 [Colletotrichum spaethianum]
MSTLDSFCTIPLSPMSSKRSSEATHEEPPDWLLVEHDMRPYTHQPDPTMPTRLAVYNALRRLAYNIRSFAAAFPDKLRRAVDRGWRPANNFTDKEYARMVEVRDADAWDWEEGVSLVTEAAVWLTHRTLGAYGGRGGQ